MAAMAIRETYTLLTNTISSNLIFLEVLFLYKDEKKKLPLFVSIVIIILVISLFSQTFYIAQTLD